MRCIEIRARRSGGPRAGRASDPIPGPGEVLIGVRRPASIGPTSCSGRAPTRRRPGPATFRASRSPAPSGVGEGVTATARRRGGVRAGGRRRLRHAVRRAGAADACRSRAALDIVAGGGDSRNVLHGVEQRVRSRPAGGGGDRAFSRRLERHRHDGHPAGRRARGAGVRDGRLRREVPRLRGARRRARPSTTGADSSGRSRS